MSETNEPFTGPDPFDLEALRLDGCFTDAGPAPVCRASAEVLRLAISAEIAEPFTDGRRVVLLKFRYDPAKVEAMKTALTAARVRLGAVMGGWLKRKKGWFVEPLCWVEVREHLETLGYRVYEDVEMDRYPPAWTLRGYPEARDFWRKYRDGGADGEVPDCLVSCISWALRRGYLVYPEHAPPEDDCRLALTWRKHCQTERLPEVVVHPLPECEGRYDVSCTPHPPAEASRIMRAAGREWLITGNATVAASVNGEDVDLLCRQILDICFEEGVHL
jgi:hypothetical protein